MDPLTLSILAIGAGAGVFAISRASSNDSPETATPPSASPVSKASAKSPSGGTRFRLGKHLDASLMTLGGTRPRAPRAPIEKSQKLFKAHVAALDLDFIKVQNEIREAAERAKKEYEKLTDDAKKAGAQKANDLLGTDLTGDESFEDAAKIIGASLGAAGGAAICGPQCGVLGAMLGAYLGTELGDWLGEQYDEYVDGWIDDAGDWVQGLAEDAWGAVGDVAGKINPF